MSITITKETKIVLDDMIVSSYIPLRFAQFMNDQPENVLCRVEGNRIICRDRDAFDVLVEMSHAYKLAAEMIEPGENGRFSLKIPTEMITEEDLNQIVACGHNLMAVICMKSEEGSRVLN